MQNLETLKTEILYNPAFLNAFHNLRNEKWETKFAYAIGRLGKVLDKQRKETDKLWNEKQNTLEWVEEKDEEGKLLSKKPKDEEAYKAIEKELLGSDFAIENRWLVNCANLVNKQITPNDLLALEPILYNTEILTD